MGTPVNTPILKIQASDKDEGLNGKFTYSVLKTEIFKISPETGYLPKCLCVCLLFLKIW